MTPTERREAELEILRQSRQGTYSYLAQELGVSRETIRRDILKLMCSHPIETVRGRYGGGVKVVKGFTLQPKANAATLSHEQIELLIELRPMLNGRKLEVLNSILAQFAP